jgi:UDP-2,3-diacylglucosamine pyrophosphatase LpxH
VNELAFVTSDLHLGAGAHDPLEDFRFDDEFGAFVDDIASTDATLVINGDFIDFAQIEPLGVDGVPDHVLWDESASLAKLNAALAGHPAVFDALGRYVDSGGALQIVVGNHDFDLAWPKVQARFRSAIGGDANGVRFAVGAVRYHGVHIQHGYHFTPENCPEDPGVLFREWNGVTYLERVWGTDFLLRFFNALEADHRYIDNVKPTVRVAYHGLRKGWIPKRELVRLIAFLKRRGIPWRAIGSVLDADQVDASTVAQAFVTPHWQQLTSAVVAAEPAEVRAALDALSREDRAALAQAPPVDLEDEEELELDGGLLGLVRPGTRESRAVDEALRKGGVTHVVFGHTHRIVDGNAMGRSYFNPGSWIPHLDTRSDYVKQKLDEHGWTLDLFDDETLYVAEPRAVRIRPTAVRSQVNLISCI